MWFGWRIDTAVPERASVDAFLGLGSNVGDRGTHLAAALRQIAARTRLRELSSVWETEPVGFSEQSPFWNLVARIETEQPPAALLATLQEIERDVGRSPSFRNGPREIDIDLLLYDDVALLTPGLEIPHPRMTSRAFVLRPLAELAPDHIVTGTQRTVRQWLDAGGPFERAVPCFPGRSLLEGAP